MHLLRSFWFLPCFSESTALVRSSVRGKTRVWPEQSLGREALPRHPLPPDRRHRSPRSSSTTTSPPLRPRAVQVHPRARCTLLCFLRTRAPRHPHPNPHTIPAPLAPANAKCHEIEMRRRRRAAVLAPRSHSSSSSSSRAPALPALVGIPPPPAPTHPHPPTRAAFIPSLPAPARQRSRSRLPSSPASLVASGAALSTPYLRRAG